MANELPYFRFVVQAWQNGKIDIERNELKGLFISICGYYWIQDCSITLALLKKKFTNDNKLIDELIELSILKHEKRHDKIEIEFLNTQFDLLSEKRKRRQDAGSKGGNAKAKRKQKTTYNDNNNNNDNDNDNDNNNTLIFPFTSTQFMAVWHILKKEKKWLKKSNAALQASLNKLAGFGELGAIQSMTDAIAGGYQGVFEPKGNLNNNQSKLIKNKNAFDEAKQKLKNDVDNASL